MKTIDIRKKTDIRKVTAALAAVVVLCMAYVLTMPAISVTEEAASSEAGFYTQGKQADAAATGAAGSADSADAATANGTAADKAAGTQSSSTAPQTTASADAPAYPAQSFTETLKNKDDEVILTANVEAPEGALPADSTLELESVKADEAKAAVEAAISYDDELAGKVQAEQTVGDCGGNPGPKPSYATSPKSLRYCMGLL